MASSLINTTGSGCIAPRIVDKDAVGYRIAQYPDGNRVLQGSYQWSQGHKWGHEWKDLPLVLVDEKGQEL